MEWLGEVPEEWEVSQIKRTTYLKARIGWNGLTSEEFQEQAFAYLVTGSDFREKFVKWDECYQVEQARYEDDPFIQLQDGDLLITKDGTIGKLAIVSGLDRPACLNSGIFVTRPLNTYRTDFMYWVLSSCVFKIFCDLKSFGSTITHLYQNVFERFTFPAPTEHEQTAIAAFLDRETAKIDALIAEQQRLIALLAEKRQAIISHAVAKGLNPDVSMKPSGVKWMGGEVPAHWELLPLRRVINKFVDYRGKTPSICETGIPLVTASTVRDGKIEHSRAPSYITQETYDKWMVRGFPDIGDVVFTTEGATFGETGRIVDATVALAQRLILFKVNPNKLSKGFLFYHFISDFGRAEQWSNTTGTTVFGIKASKLKATKITLPPLTEQKEIERHIERETKLFIEAESMASQAIKLLQERRIALISAAVTGQIDVRGVA